MVNLTFRTSCQLEAGGGGRGWGRDRWRWRDMKRDFLLSLGEADCAANHQRQTREFIAPPGDFSLCLEPSQSLLIIYSSVYPFPSPGGSGSHWSGNKELLRAARADKTTGSVWAESFCCAASHHGSMQKMISNCSQLSDWEVSLCWFQRFCCSHMQALYSSCLEVWKLNKSIRINSFRGEQTGSRLQVTNEGNYSKSFRTLCNRDQKLKTS